MKDTVDQRLYEEAIKVKNIVKARREYRNGKKIKVLKRDNLLDDIYKTDYEVTNDTFPNIIEICDVNLLNRAKRCGVCEEKLRELKRLNTTTITNAQLVQYLRSGEGGIILS